MSAEAGIKKRVHAHLFRHSRMTELANQITEAQQCAYAGWVMGSDMPRIYVHLSMRDLDDAILAANGIKKSEERVSDVKICARCTAHNQAVSKLCHRCMLPLDDKTAVEVEQRRALASMPEAYEKAIVAVLSKPENREMLKAIVRETPEVP